jgi:hypothetical protein
LRPPPFPTAGFGSCKSVVFAFHDLYSYMSINHIRWIHEISCPHVRDFEIVNGVMFTTDPPAKIVQLRIQVNLRLIP